MSHRAPRDVLLLAALFTTSGVLHFVRPRPFEQMVPHALPRKLMLVHATGAAELVCAAGLVSPPTRRAAGLLSAGLLIVIFPANIQMTIDIFERRSVSAKAAAIVRLPLQLPMIRTAWRAFRRTD